MKAHIGVDAKSGLTHSLVTTAANEHDLNQLGNLLHGVRLENGIYGHSRFCNTDFDDKLACLNLSGV
ncbi:transposase [Escherichia coli]|nr:transposase [Escherichia coli]